MTNLIELMAAAPLNGIELRALAVTCSAMLDFEESGDLDDSAREFLRQFADVVGRHFEGAWPWQ